MKVGKRVAAGKCQHKKGGKDELEGDEGQNM